MSGRPIFNIKAVEAKITRITEATQDPYLIITNGKLKQQTSVQEDRPTNPQWRETFTFPKNEDLIFKLTLMDWDSDTKSDLIGEGSMDLSEFRKMNIFKPKEVTLTYKGKPAAIVILEIELTTEKEEIKPPIEVAEKKKPLIEPKFFNDFSLKMKGLQEKFDLRSIDDFMIEKGLKNLIKAGFIEMSRKKPANPTKFLGEYLLAHDPAATSTTVTKKK